MSITATLITKDELDIGKVADIFHQAFLDAKMDAQGDLCLTLDGIKIWPMVDTARGLMALRCGLSVRPEATRLQVLELSNRVNDGLVFVRACCPAAKVVLWLDHYIDTNAGVTAEEVVDEARRFRTVLSSIPPLDTENILM